MPDPRGMTRTSWRAWGEASFSRRVLERRLFSPFPEGHTTRWATDVDKLVERAVACRTSPIEDHEHEIDDPKSPEHVYTVVGVPLVPRKKCQHQDNNGRNLDAQLHDVVNSDVTVAFVAVRHGVTSSDFTRVSVSSSITHATASQRNTRETEDKLLRCEPAPECAVRLDLDQGGALGARLQ